MARSRGEASQFKFRVGDTVKLKSGGPEMTIHSQPMVSDGAYSCQWFARSGSKLERGQFYEDELEGVSKRA